MSGNTKCREVPGPPTVRVKPHGYQPGKAELEEPVESRM